MSVIGNLPPPVELVITQVDDHVKMRLISQLIGGISRVFQKFLKYFNGTIISASFVLPSAGVFPVIFILDVVIQNLPSYHSAHLCNIAVKFCHKILSSLQYCHNYRCILPNCTLELLYQYL